MKSRTRRTFLVLLLAIPVLVGFLAGAGKGLSRRLKERNREALIGLAHEASARLDRSQAVEAAADLRKALDGIDGLGNKEDQMTVFEGIVRVSMSAKFQTKDREGLFHDIALKIARLQICHDAWEESNWKLKALQQLLDAGQSASLSEEAQVHLIQACLASVAEVKLHPDPKSEMAVLNARNTRYDHCMKALMAIGDALSKRRLSPGVEVEQMRAIAEAQERIRATDPKRNWDVFQGIVQKVVVSRLTDHDLAFHRSYKPGAPQKWADAPYLVGKVCPICLTREREDQPFRAELGGPVFNALPQDLRSLGCEEIGTLVGIYVTDVAVGTYHREATLDGRGMGFTSSGLPKMGTAYRVDMDVVLFDRTKGTPIASKRFTGGKPPDRIEGGGDGYGERPWKEIAEYLANLPRISSGP
ncbi:MAG: hypothetical protein AB1696_15460 [Planctomycetota bacterium]